MPRKKGTHLAPHVTVHKRGRYYHFQFYVEGRQFRGSTRMPAMKQALLFAEELQRQITDDFYGFQRRAETRGLTLGQLSKTYKERLQEGRFSAVHIRCCKARLERWLELLGGPDIFVMSVTTSKVQEAVNKMYEEKFKKTTVHNYLQFLSSFFKMAVDDKLIREVPFSVKKPKPDRRVRCATETEIKKVLAGLNFDDTLDRVILIALYTGYRLGDIRALDWRNVDWEKKVIRIITHKTNAAVETPISGRLWEWLKFNKKDSGLICPGVRENAGSRVGDRIAALCGSRYTTHELRHTFASNIKDSLLRQQLLGHTSLETTAIYTHYNNLDAFKEEVEGLYQ